MTPLDLTAVAAANSPARRAAASGAIAADPTGTVGRFARLVADSAFSTNVTAAKISAFDHADEILDSRQCAVAAAGGNKRKGHHRFRASAGPWLVRREAFEDLWRHGRQFVYGAVNAGGTGVVSFGAYCVVATPEVPVPSVLATFPADSAQRYTTEAGAVSRPTAAADATAWDRRADLVVAERAPEAAATAEDAWPELVCSPSRYFETVRAGRWPTSSITEVRMDRSMQDGLARLRARHLAKEALTDVERHQVDAYRAVNAWRKRHGTTIVRVP